MPRGAAALSKHSALPCAQCHGVLRRILSRDCPVAGIRYNDATLKSLPSYRGLLVIALLSLARRWIGKHYWNLGYCTEAATAAIGFGFNDLGLNKMHAFITSINPASGRVLEKLGMLLEGHRSAHIRKADQYYDTDDYGILRRDYLERLST